MTQELLYTSAPKGLKPGSRGFCTVVSTQGMAAPLASALESLSGYRPVFPPGDPRAAENPVVLAHTKLTAGGRTYSVLSRVADYGLDYSQRTNKLAHHLVLDPAERPAGGPAWALGQPGLMQTDWDGEPRILASGRAIRPGDQAPSICQTWRDMTGDAGWAGVLAEAFLADPDRLVYLIFEPGMDLLPLLAEAIALLPPERRWDVTFSSYFANLPPGAICNWRCVLNGSPEAHQSRRFVQALRINLCEEMGRAEGGPLVDMSRTGKMPAADPLAPTGGALDPRGLTGGSDKSIGEVAPPPLPPDSAPYALERAAGTPPPPPKRRRRKHQDAEDAAGRARAWKGIAIALALILLLGGGLAWAFIGRHRWMELPRGILGQKWVNTHENRASGESDRDPAAPRPLASNNHSAKPPQAVAQDVLQKRRAVETGAESSRPDAAVESAPVRDSSPDAQRVADKALLVKPPAVNTELPEGHGRAPLPAAETANDVAQDAPAPAENFSPLNPLFLFDIVTSSNKTTTLRAPFPSGESDEKHRLELVVPEEMSRTIRSAPVANGIRILRVGMIDEEIATLTLERDSSGLIIGLEAALVDELAPLKWCALRIASSTSKYDYLLHKKHAEPDIRTFESGAITWTIRAVPAARVPLLSVDYIVVALDSTVFVFRPDRADENESNERAFELACPELVEHLTRELKWLSPDDLKDIRAAAPAIKWDQTGTGRDCRLQSIRESRWWSRAKAAFNKRASILRDRLQKSGLERDVPQLALERFSEPLNELLDAFIQRNSIRIGDIEKLESDAALMGAGLKPRDRQERDLRTAVATLHTQARRLYALRDGLRSVEVRAARVYYSIVANDGDVVEVDVIRFGDPPKDESISSR